MNGIKLIEKIHYFLCYNNNHNYLFDECKIILRRQSNVLYYTSRISRKLSSKLIYWTTDLKNKTYFISYILYIKFQLDIYLYNIKKLYTQFAIEFTKPYIYYELYCFKFLNYDFSFLEEKPLSWNIY